MSPNSGGFSLNKCSIVYFFWREVNFVGSMVNGQISNQFAIKRSYYNTDVITN